jgi:hypothetical protein
MNRRRFLAAGIASGMAAIPHDTVFAQGGEERRDWKNGDVAHLLPTVDHENILIKASFSRPPSAPRLGVGGKRFPGRQTDSEGKFWSFHAGGLAPAQRHQCTLTDASNIALCDPWPLNTFPRPTDTPKSFRAVMFTCAGGHDVTKRFLPIPMRIALLQRALSFEPDALVAIGDHVYWDTRSRSSRSAEGLVRWKLTGHFDRTLPVLGTANETVLKQAVGPQIADLYRTYCRSVPVFFLQDDHDHFDNDEADDKLVTFPPDWFNLNAARASQLLYYPEFLSDASRPVGLASSSALDRTPAHLSESFGTLRFGELVEMLFYDCRRHVTLTGPSAGFVPPDVESWLKARMSAPGVAHVVNVPSIPVGWTAGKWGEWYADMQRDRKPTLEVPKPYWQSGWRTQHDRLAQAASRMPGRIPLFVSGDLHAIGYGRMRRTGGIDLSANPVNVILAGTLGSGTNWPSGGRGMIPQVPNDLEVDEAIPAIEQNGFIIADFLPDRISVRFFRWDRRTQTAADMETLVPFRTIEMRRPATT